MLVAVLLTLAVAAAVPMLGVGIGLGLTPVCVIAESAVAAAPARGPEAAHAASPAGQSTLAAPCEADVALALRAAILPHTTALPPPAAC
jgi:hypothetical protein